MTLTSYERTDSWTSTVSWYSGSTLIDPSGNIANIEVYQSDGVKYISATGANDGTVGVYFYRISTNSTQPLGIYKIIWNGSFFYDNFFGYMPRTETEAVIITDIVQS